MSRPPPLLIAALLLCALLAGCAGKDAPTDGGLSTGTTEQTILDPGADGAGEVAGSSQSVAGGKAEAAKGNGEIRGTVQDDAGLTVADALVSLLGSESSATTDAAGGFRFTNVSAGDHTLRVTASAAYRVHEGEVSVVADRVTLVTITLVPLDGRGPGYRPHLHDYWGDKTELDLIDQEYDLRSSAQYDRYGVAGQVLVGGYEPNNGNWWWPLPIPDRDDGRPPIVLPGTKELRITLDWDTSEVTVTSFVIGYFTAQTTTETKLSQQARGEPRTLPLAEGDADNGHQGFSLWRFNLRPVVQTTAPQTALGSVRVHVVMVKDEAVPVEPAHEDFWNGTTSLVVMDGSVVRKSISNYVGGCGNEGQTMTLDAGRLVPPGTARLTMHFTWMPRDHPSEPAGTMRLLWKSADLRPDTPLDQWTVGTAKTTTATSADYDVPVLPGQTDAFYQKKSNWLLNAERTDLPDTCLHNNEAHQQWTLELIAHKDPAFV